MAFAIFRGRLCCLLVKCAATSDGYTAYRHFLQTTTCHLDKCSKKSSARSMAAGILPWIFFVAFLLFLYLLSLGTMSLPLVFVPLNAAWRLLILVDFLLMALPAVCFHRT
jgi:hypothetical protein